MKNYPSTYGSAQEKTLEGCEALIFSFEPDGLTQLVVWCDRPGLLRPVEKVVRLRDLKPGDAVYVEEERLVLRSVGVFR